MDKVDSSIITKKLWYNAKMMTQWKVLLINFLIKYGKTKKNLYFLYNGQILNEDLIICPKCEGNAKISIEKIKIYGCKEKHQTEDIQLNEFEKSQFMLRL